MSKLLIDEEPLQVLPSLAMRVGLNEAIVLQQIHYWLRKEGLGIHKNGHKWIFNTIRGWQENFPFWSESTIERALASLKKQKVLISEQLADDRRDKTNFYRINYRLLGNASPQIDGMEDVNLTGCTTSTCCDVIRTENTTENTTEITVISDTAHAAPELPGMPDKKAGPNALNIATWEAYASAYFDRYNVYPARNAKVNGQVANLAKRLGQNAPHVAAWFVSHNNRWYVQHSHSLDGLLKDAEGLYTQWATNHQVTESQARSADRLGNAYHLLNSIKFDDSEPF